MKFIDEYRDRALVDDLLTVIRREATGDYVFMEVCGSHTHAIRRYGFSSLLPENIRLLSGPGCPVCVSDQSFIDKAVALAEQGHILASFGDLVRVPGTRKSLAKCREEGADVRIIYSPLEALDIARNQQGRNIVFPAIGFETTAPSTAVTVKQAAEEGLDNFFVLSSHKLMPPAMRAVIEDGVAPAGYICPGHVSAITGSRIYEEFPEKFNVAAVVSGFEPTDILQSVLMLVRQVNNRDFKTEIQYKRAVRTEGNIKARNMMDEIFQRSDERWRGFGVLPQSGLKLRNEYAEWDADRCFSIDIPKAEIDSGCICGEILKGKNEPADCSLFARKCTPREPVGACMVSAEGSCNAYFKYRNYGK